MYLLHWWKNGIYVNISLFLSYSDVTIGTQTQTVSRSDGHRSHPDPVHIQIRSAPRDDLYSPESQQRPGQLDEPQRLIPSEDPVS